MTGKFKQNAKFILAGIDGRIVYYDNGNVISKQVGTEDWYSLVYGNGKYVAVGGGISVGNNIIACSSNNGATWSTATISTIRGFCSVAYGKGVFVAVGNYGAIAYSNDGLNWKQPSINLTDTFTRIAYGNGKFIAINASTNTFIISSDGISWSPVDLFYGRDIIFDGKRFVLLKTGGKTAFSSDGITWENGNTTSDFNNVYKIAYGNGVYVLVCSNKYTGSTGSILYSTDAINWSIGLSPSDKVWYDVSYGNGCFVAVGNRGNFAKSNDGKIWELSTIGGSFLYSICHIQ